MDWLRIFGISAALLNMVTLIPYIRDIYAGKTKPERASWVIWTTLSFIFFITNFSEGATESLWFAGGQVLITCYVLGLSIKRGIGGLERRDKIGLSLAGLGLLLWYFTNNAVYALVLAVIVDYSGVALTAIKTWEKPQTETLFSWAAMVPIGILTMLSVGEMDYFLLTFPFTVTLAGLIMAGTIIYRRAHTQNT